MTSPWLTQFLQLNLNRLGLKRRAFQVKSTTQHASLCVCVCVCVCETCSTIFFRLDPHWHFSWPLEELRKHQPHAKKAS